MRLVIVILLLGITSARAQQIVDPHDKVTMGALATHLHNAVRAACSCEIDGISVGKWEDKKTWRVDFHNSQGRPGDNTPDEIAKANAALKDFDPMDPVNRAP